MTPISLEEITLLLIDDDDGVLDISRKWLTRYGYQKIETATSAGEAIRMFQGKRHFDVVVADMRMEHASSGFEIIEEGEKRLASVMIVLTANDNVLDCRKAFKMGAWDYIPKSTVDPNFNCYEELHLSIKKAIEFHEEWGNSRDESWVSSHLDELIDQFPGEYVAVMDEEPIAHQKTEEALRQEMRDRNLPIFTPIILKIPEGGFDV